MSSFSFSDGDQGPPADGYSNLLSPNPVGNICQNGWVCEHRWRQIYSMVHFRNAVAGTTVSNWWSNGNQQIAFSRGNKGFIVFNLDSYAIDLTLPTGLSAGTYCDVASGSKTGSTCSGKSITVNSSGEASIYFSNAESEGFMAFHVNAKL